MRHIKNAAVWIERNTSLAQAIHSDYYQSYSNSTCCDRWEINNIRENTYTRCATIWLISDYILFEKQSIVLFEYISLVVPYFFGLNIKLFTKHFYFKGNGHMHNFHVFRHLLTRKIVIFPSNLLHIIDILISLRNMYVAYLQGLNKYTIKNVPFRKAYCDGIKANVWRLHSLTANFERVFILWQTHIQRSQECG